MFATLIQNTIDDNKGQNFHNDLTNCMSTKIVHNFIMQLIVHYNIMKQQIIMSRHFGTSTPNL
jgi:hypothetical protein